jgi:hypothetical protein
MDCPTKIVRAYNLDGATAGWTCIYGAGEARANADTPSEAICLAALIAKGVVTP